MKWLIAILVVILAFIGFVVVPALTPNVTIDEERMLARINVERYSKELVPLAIDPTLEIEAQERAEGLCIGEFSHANFMPELINSKYEYIHAGENLAQGTWSTDQYVQAWIESETHYQNIVKPEYRQTGIGVADCGNRHIIVMWFATKK